MTRDDGSPEDLRDSPRTLEGYARGRRPVAQEYLKDGQFKPPLKICLLFQISTNYKCTAPQRAAPPSASKEQPNQASLRADPHIKNSAF